MARGCFNYFSFLLTNEGRRAVFRGQKSEIGSRRSEVGERQRADVRGRRSGTAAWGKGHGGRSRELDVGWVEPLSRVMGFVTTQPTLRKRGVGTTSWEGRNPSRLVNRKTNDEILTFTWLLNRKL